MWQRRFTFFISLIIILILSWCNAHFFGKDRSSTLVIFVNQSMHVFFLITFCIIGYVNLRHTEKWVRWLWLFSYSTVFAISIFASAYFYLSGFTIAKFSGSEFNRQLGHAVADLRNLFTSPLPFLVVFLLYGAVKRLPANSEEKL